MIEPTLLSHCVVPADFIAKAIKVTTSTDIKGLLSELPIVPDDDYAYDEENPAHGWQPGKFHWVPVGRERGNAGRIKQANQPISPIAERTVNGMEAIIELARARELLQDPGAPPPSTPRDAVMRYFTLPPLDQLPKLDTSEASKATRIRARELARQLRVRLMFDKPSREFTIAIEDDGIGQSPDIIHKTLLSLGATTKADKWYLIGVFGQGGVVRLFRMRLLMGYFPPGQGHARRQAGRRGMDGHQAHHAERPSRRLFRIPGLPSRWTRALYLRC